MMARHYDTALAFKVAVEQRLRNDAAASGVDIQRRRRLFLFDRYLARVFSILEDAVVLKGGLAVELRIERARTTKDIDLSMHGTPDGVLAHLQKAGRLDLGDHLSFEVQVDPRHPVIDAEGMAYEGLRFKAQCHMAGKAMEGPFCIDVAIAEPMHGMPEEVESSAFLQFADVDPVCLRIYPLETHIAEKLHAYTLPRTRPNSRVKDLPDIALLASVREIEGAGLRLAIDKTFEHRATHAVPSSFPDPPRTWAPVFERIASTDNLPWKTMEEVLRVAREFLDPVLTRTAQRWRPSMWQWSPHRNTEGER